MDAEESQLEKAVRLIEGGKRKEAKAVINNALMDNQDNAAAWQLLSKITNNPAEREFAVFQLRRLGAEPDPDTAGAENSATIEVRVRQAYEQAKTGNRRIALNIIKPVLLKYPGHPGAWFVKGIAAKDRGGYLYALKILEALASNDPEAQSYYNRLSKFKFDGEPRKNVAQTWFVAGSVALLLLLAGVALVLPLLRPTSDEENDLFPSEEIPLLACEQLIADAIQVSDKTCQRIGANEVCYGNDRLTSEIIGDPDEFDLVGDVLEVDKLLSLQASPLNLAEDLWGVAVFKLRANLEGTVPGQNVTFVVFGDTDIHNASGDMSAFYFSTGFGGIKCNGVDFDGLQVNTPDGAGIKFTANGVELILEGNAVMTADRGGQMNVTLVTGSGTVKAEGVTHAMTPGMQVSVPIDENLEASGAPSEPQTLEPEQVTMVCDLYGIACPPGEASLIQAGPAPEGFVGLETTGNQPETPQGIAGSSSSASPTSTLVPPTNTPEFVCPNIAVEIIDYGEFIIFNSSSQSIRLERMGMAWPPNNGDWIKVVYGDFGEEEPNLPPGLTYTFQETRSQRTIQPGGSLDLAVQFATENNAGEYSASFYFDIGCSTFISGD